MTQLDLFRKSRMELFEEWVHTPEGREVADRFIKIAWGFHQRGQPIGAKAIWERLRWHYQLRADRGRGEWKLDNSHCAYLARFAMDREPRLAGFFSTRRTGRDPTPRRALLIRLHG